jgi:hypothetical protein
MQFTVRHFVITLVWVAISIAILSRVPKVWPMLVGGQSA